MRRLALLLGLLATPAAAFEPMTASQCRAGWVAVVDMMPTNPADRDTALAVGHRVTPDGWCRISGADPALRGANFATVDWQADGIDEAIATGGFPLALRVRFDDLRPDETRPPSRTDFVRNPPLDLWMALRRVPETRQLILEELRITSPAGDDLLATAVFDRVDLSNLGMAQMSMGSVALRQVNARARLNGWVESQIVPELGLEVRGDPAAARQWAIETVEDLPAALFAPGAIDNLRTFAEAFPAPRGDLELSFASETGVGMLQFVMFGYQRWLAEDGPDDPGFTAEAVAAYFGTARFDAIWTADPDQTE